MIDSKVTSQQIDLVAKTEIEIETCEEIKEKHKSFISQLKKKDNTVAVKHIKNIPTNHLEQFVSEVEKLDYTLYPEKDIQNKKGDEQYLSQLKEAYLLEKQEKKAQEALKKKQNEEKTKLVVNPEKMVKELSIDEMNWRKQLVEPETEDIEHSLEEKDSKVKIEEPKNSKKQSVKPKTEDLKHSLERKDSKPKIEESNVSNKQSIEPKTEDFEHSRETGNINSKAKIEDSKDSKPKTEDIKHSLKETGNIDSKGKREESKSEGKADEIIEPSNRNANNNTTQRDANSPSQTEYSLSEKEKHENMIIAQNKIIEEQTMQLMTMSKNVIDLQAEIKIRDSLIQFLKESNLSLTTQNSCFRQSIQMKVRVDLESFILIPFYLNMLIVS